LNSAWKCCAASIRPAFSKTSYWWEVGAAPRRNKDKQTKDRIQAVEVLREVILRGDAEKVRAKFQSLPIGWRKGVSLGLKAVGAGDISATLA